MMCKLALDSVKRKEQRERRHTRNNKKNACNARNNKESACTTYMQEITRGRHVNRDGTLAAFTLKHDANGRILVDKRFHHCSRNARAAVKDAAGAEAGQIGVATVEERCLQSGERNGAEQKGTGAVTGRKEVIAE
jgi:hypothetical protein